MPDITQPACSKDNHPISLLLLIFTALWLISSDATAAPVKLYLYHKQAPFITGDINYPEQGLVFDLAELLMHQSNAPEVRVEIRPRLRLDKELRGWLNGQCPKHKNECDSNWMLFGVIPEWGWKAQAEQTFNWVPLFRDADILVSSRQKPVRDFTPASLTGLVFAGLHGHQYPGILGQLIQTNKLTRDNGSSNLAVLQRVAKGRADITLIRRSTLNYLIRNDLYGLTEQLYIPDTAYNTFTLQVMLPANRPDLCQWLISVLNSAAWQAKLKSYGIPPLDTHGSE